MKFENDRVIITLGDNGVGIDIKGDITYPACGLGDEEFFYQLVNAWGGKKADIIKPWTPKKKS